MSPRRFAASPIGRLPYVAAGVALFALKFAIDRAVSGALFNHRWPLTEYLAPGSSLALLFVDGERRAFYTTMLAIAVPFIVAGVWLTARRLRAVGITTAWSVLFFVPVVNFAMFALLAAIRDGSADTKPALDDVPPATAKGAPAPVLAYRDASTPIGPTLIDHLFPTDPSLATALAVFLPAALAVAATVFSVHFLANYGWGLFVGVPFSIGLLSTVLHGARVPRTSASSIGVACLALTCYGTGLLLIAFEGAGCLIMTAPIAYPLTIIGSIVGLSLRARPRCFGDDGRIVWVIVLFLPAFIGAERAVRPPPQVYAVTTSVEVDAPPERVWLNVIDFPPIDPPREWLFRLGIAYPLRAEIAGRGVGAVRSCVFSTGPFVEPITAWDAPRLLKFDVTSNPPPLREWSPYAAVHPPHLENFLVSRGGQFLLEPLPGGRTRLTGTTWYRHSMWPAGYWRLWSDHILHRIHLRVLTHVKALSERAA